MRNGIVAAAGVLMLVLVNWNILGRERLLADGEVVLLELAPVDPRSLMQGDYMALRFALGNDVARARGLRGPQRTDIDPGDLAENGRVVLGLDARGVGSFRRIDDGTPLAADERLLRYQLRNRDVKIATNAFFFQEGDADKYQPARYGELRVAADGEALLTGLRGKELEKLGAGSAPRALR